MMLLKLLAVLAVVLFPSRKNPRIEDYDTVVNRVAEMVWDNDVYNMTAEHGLNVVNVTWEDTGRYYGSCWGPNISDMTIQVHHGDADNPTLTCMPVIRHPNFHDLSADIDPDHFYLLTGNEYGEELEPVSLTEYVDHLRYYLNDPWCWPGRTSGLLCDRDSLVLVSAQAVFLPIQDSGTATFNPVLFNYQSYEENPAVLTILATREGTSVTIIDNVRDGVPGTWSWGQRLFFNEDGMRASLTGQRISDFLEETHGSTGPTVTAAGEEGLNMVLLIQIPLKQKEAADLWFEGTLSGEADLCAPMSACEDMSSTVEAAVIGHGELEGPFTEIDGLRIERDTRFPIRVTVQFYKATDNGIASEQDIREIAEQIERVYDDADYVGSLVVPDPDEYRPTDWNRNDVARELTPFWDSWRTKYLASIGRLDLLDRWNER